MMSRTATHPGEILADELQEIGISATELFRQLNVPGNWVPQMIAGKRNITPNAALRLAKWFGTTLKFWLNLEQSHDLRLAEQQIGDEIEAIPTREKEPALGHRPRLTHRLGHPPVMLARRARKEP